MNKQLIRTLMIGFLAFTVTVLSGCEDTFKNSGEEETTEQDNETSAKAETEDLERELTETAVPYLQPAEARDGSALGIDDLVLYLPLTKENPVAVARSSSLITDLSFTTGPEGKADTAAQFNGTSSQVKMDNLGYLTTGVPEFTLSFWLKANFSETGDMSLIETAPDYLEHWSQGHAGYLVDSSKWGTSMMMYGSQMGVHLERLEDDEWHHIAIVFTENRQSDWYINGRWQGADLGPEPLRASDLHYLTIGGATREDNEKRWAEGFFEGAMSELIVLHRTLTVEDVKELMLEGIESLKTDDQPTIGIATIGGTSGNSTY